MMVAVIDTLTADEMPMRPKGLPDFRPYVARGAALLDHRVPDWAHAVDVSTLRLESPVSCVVGQLAIKAMLNGPLDGYFEGVPKLFRGARWKQRAACEHGFNLPEAFSRWYASADYAEKHGDMWAYGELTRLWAMEVTKRLRKAEKAAPVAQA